MFVNMQNVSREGCGVSYLHCVAALGKVSVSVTPQDSSHQASPSPTLCWKLLHIQKEMMSDGDINLSAYVCLNDTP